MPLDDDERALEPPLAGSGELTPSPRASDADRDTALERLKAAFVGGQLTDEELDQRAQCPTCARPAQSVL